MIEQLSLGNVCANGCQPLTTYAWGTDFIADVFTDTELFDFTASGTGAAVPTVAAFLDGVGGIFQIASGTADDSYVSACSLNEFVTPATGKRYFYKVRFRVSDATQSDLFMGLAVNDTDPVGGVADGIYFRKDDGDALLDIGIVGAGAGTAATTGATLTALHTVVDDTWVDAAFEVLVTGSGTCVFTVWVDGVAVLKDKTVTANAPATDMGVTFAIQAGEAVQKFLDLDYVAAGGDR